MIQAKAAFSGISVDDLSKAKDFYTNILGLKLIDEKMGLDLELPGGGRLFIYDKKDHQPATFTVLNFMVDDIDKAVDDLTSNHVTFEHYDSEYMKTDEKGICRNDGTHPGPKGIAWFKDPADNFLAIIQEK
jgi:catechol 2,3-dioxygenase-like lactoylglutathione lyase family enzyme